MSSEEEEEGGKTMIMCFCFVPVFKRTGQGLAMLGSFRFVWFAVVFFFWAIGTNFEYLFDFPSKIDFVFRIFPKKIRWRQSQFQKFNKSFLKFAINRWGVRDGKVSRERAETKLIVDGIAA